MKLSRYATKIGISYSTALRWFHDGTIKGYQAPSGTIIVVEDPEATAKTSQERTAIYARVSSHEQRDNLERQAERLSQYCTVTGYQVVAVVKEIASGVNDNRPKLTTLLQDQTITRLVVEHKDRLTRFGFRYIEVLMQGQGRTIEVVNVAENDKEDLLHDLVSIIYSMCARLYGQRRAKRKRDQVVGVLKQDNGEAQP